MTERSFAEFGTIPKLAAVALVAFTLSGFSGAIGTAQAADPAAGKALAMQWCSSCHLVAEEQSTASSVSLPSFYDISEDNGWTSEKLSTFLANPHAKMPNMTLGNYEIANLVSYIGSLKK
ncbi:MAG: c-type cytochrome [Roseibium sp.]